MSVPNHRTRQPITKEELRRLARFARLWREYNEATPALYRPTAVQRIESGLLAQEKRTVAHELGQLLVDLERGNRDLSPEGLLAAVAGEAELLSAGRVEAARLVDAGGDRRG